MVDEQKFFAWLDDELPPGEAAEVEAAVARDPELSRLAGQHRAMGTGLRRAFDTVAAAPLPERLQPDGASGAKLVNLQEARAKRDARTALPLWKQAAAMAATLMLGIAAGNLLVSGSSSPIQPEAGRLVAGAELEEALYAQLASAPADEGPRIGLTFRDSEGDICRTFTDRAASGLACRQDGDWVIRGLFQSGEGQSTDYRMASGANPALMELVDSTMAGEPLDASQEAQAMERGWR